MKLRPLKDSVIIELIPEKDRTKGGIYIPDNAQDKPTSGKVIAIGPECKEIKEGDQVAYGRYAGTELIIGDEGFLVLLEKDILAVMEG